MRKLSFAPLLMFLLPCASAQTAPNAPSNDPGWARVQRLSPGSSLHIKTTHGTVRCTLRAVDEETLTCVKKTDLTLQRSEIKSIGVSHRGRSTLVGLAIGTGGGAIAGAAGGPNDGIVTKGAVALVLGVGFGIVGALVGAATDFTGGNVYRAP